MTSIVSSLMDYVKKNRDVLILHIQRTNKIFAPLTSLKKIWEKDKKFVRTYYLERQRTISFKCRKVFFISGHQEIGLSIKGRNKDGDILGSSSPKLFSNFFPGWQGNNFKVYFRKVLPINRETGRKFFI